jgi:hypothetical protein
MAARARRAGTTDVNYADLENQPEITRLIEGRGRGGGRGRSGGRGGAGGRVRRESEGVCCSFCFDPLPLDKESGVRKPTLVAENEAQTLCKKCTAALFGGLGEGSNAEQQREPVALDAAITRLGLKRPPDEAANTTHNSLISKLGKTEERTAREVRRALLCVLHRMPGGSLLEPEEMRDIRETLVPALGAAPPGLPSAAALAGAQAQFAAREWMREAERRARDFERRVREDKRVLAECEAVLLRMLRIVERQVWEEEQQADKAAVREAKMRKREEAEVRALLDGVLARVERQVQKDEKDAEQRRLHEERLAEKQKLLEHKLAEKQMKVAEKQMKQAERQQTAEARAAAAAAASSKDPGKGGKRKRCGVCAGCRADNCGTCGQCKDMLQFGGQGRRRQPCKWRTCTGNVDVDAVVSTWLMCDRCQKWRIVPDLPGVVPVGDDAKWFCEMNPDRRHNECSVPQQPDDAVLDEAVIAELVDTKGRGEAGDSPAAAEAASPAEADDQEQPPATMPPTAAGVHAMATKLKEAEARLTEGGGGEASAGAKLKRNSEGGGGARAPQPPTTRTDSASPQPATAARHRSS